MAIVFRSAANVQSTTTANKPAGVVSGDVMIAHVIDEGNHTITPPAGWTQIDNIGVASNSIRAATFWKLAGGSEPSTYVWTISGATYTEIAIAAYSGVDTSTPINAHNTASDPNSPTLAVPNVTTTVANCVLSIGVNEWFGNGWSVSGVTSYTFDSGLSSSSAWDLGAFHKAAATATTYGGEVPGWGNGNGGNFKSITVVALQPAGAAPVVGWSPDLWPPAKPVAKPKPAPARPGWPTTTPPGYTFPIVAAPAGGVVALSGTMSAGATLTDTLDVAHSLSGTASAGATLSDTLDVSKPIAGTATATATLSETLDHSVPLSGAATGTAALSDTLDHTVPLSGSAAAGATLSETLDHAVPLAGTLSAGASLSETMTHAVPLGGSANAGASLTGGLNGTVDISGAMSAGATMSTGLQVAKPLAGTATAAASTTGALTHAVPLGGLATMLAALVAGVTVDGPNKIGTIAASARALNALTVDAYALDESVAGAREVNSLTALATARDQDAASDRALNSIALKET